jgi:hypothetical protein
MSDQEYALALLAAFLYASGCLYIILTATKGNKDD